MFCGSGADFYLGQGDNGKAIAFIFAGFLPP